MRFSRFASRENVQTSSKYTPGIYLGKYPGKYPLIYLLGIYHKKFDRKLKLVNTQGIVRPTFGYLPRGFYQNPRLGILQSVIDQAIDQWQVCLNACSKAKGVLFHNIPSTTCYETYSYSFFYFTTFLTFRAGCNNLC